MNRIFQSPLLLPLLLLSLLVLFNKSSSRVVLFNNEFRMVAWYNNEAPPQLPDNSNYTLISATTSLLVRPPFSNETDGIMVYYSDVVCNLVGWQLSPSFVKFLKATSKFSAVLVASSTPSDPGEEISCCCLPSLHLPIFIIEHAAKPPLSTLSINGSVLTVSSVDPNRWHEYFYGPFYLVWWITLLLLSILAGILSSYRLVQWYLFFKKPIIVGGTLCLIFELLSSIARILLFCLGAASFYAPIPHISILFTLPASLSAIATTLLFFFWLELTSNHNLNRSTSYETTLIPVVCTCTAILLIEIITDISKTILFIPEIFIIPNIVFASVGLCLSIACIWTARKVLIKILKPGLLPNDLVKQVRNVTRLLIVSGVLYLVASVFFAISYFTTNMAAYNAVNYVVYFMLSVQSLVQIVIVKVPKKRPRSPTVVTVPQIVRPVSKSSSPPPLPPVDSPKIDHPLLSDSKDEKGFYLWEGSQ